ncbi:MAG TPA: SusC/RagA family TonB-linked outer membrane protein [Puia sp.]|nr:SusC/RagA family TonB-linked outer membrane protein [Puia sp.]
MSKKLSLIPVSKWSLLLLGFVLFSFNVVLAQSQVVKGKIVDASGAPLAGANVAEKGSKKGVISDVTGNFTLNVSSADAVLVVSYVGYKSIEISAKDQSYINVTLQASNDNTLTGVVVTALGISRSKKSLGYDVGQINGEDMNKVAQTNVLSSMAGKVPGVVISSTGPSPNASVSMVIRGIRSLNSDNQPLFVIDGVPVKNTMNNVAQNNGGGNDVDYGNTISDLNPNDIENVSILKGPSAAALYGSRAGNGVVLITTKSGKKSKGLGITFTTMDEAAVPYHYFPLNLDYTVGTDPYTTPNPYNSWNGVIVDLAGTDTYRFGTPLNKGINAIQWNSPLQADGTYKALPMVSHDNLKNLSQTGITSTNSVSVENSTDRDNFRFAFSNMVNKGIVPNSGLTRYNLALNIDHKVSKGFTLSTSINYIRSSSDNIVAGNGDGAIAAAAYLSPSVDVRQLKNYWITPGVQQRKALPPVGTDDSPGALDPYDNGDNNPYFVLNQVKNSYLRNHIFGNVKASFDITPHLSAFVRYSQDLFYEDRETKISKSLNDELNGYYGLSNGYNTESNTDMLVTYHNRFLEKFDISASVGGNLLYTEGTFDQVFSKPGAGLNVGELFNVSNIAPANVGYNSNRYQKSINSVYATASVGYNDMIYLDLTGRNDWSSTLPAGNNSYFYPSASLSLILSKMVRFPNYVSLVKVRGGWASVGKDTDPYNLLGYVNSGNFGGIFIQTLSGQLKNANLKPEIATSPEVGVDLAFLRSRLRFSGTIYRSDNKNQILGINIPGSTGATSTQINAGLIRSQGIELQLGGTIISNRDWTWDATVNYTKNNTYIMSLANGQTFFSFWQDGPTGSWTYAKGQPIPNQVDAKGNQLISDGKIGQMWDNVMATVTDKNSPYYGYPLLDDGGGFQKQGGGSFQQKRPVGNFNPKLLMGFQTSVTYKMITLSASVDMRLGGIFYSKTYRYMQSDATLKRQEDVGIRIPASYANNIPAYLKSNPNAFIKVTGFQQYHLVGGPSTEQGGFPYQTNGNITLNDGAFYPGVYDDGNGGYVENLGDPNLTKYDNYEDAVTNGGWNFATMDMFDASYIKLRDLTISVALPKKLSDKLNVQGISLGVYTKNVILWTKAKAGVDPELAFNFQPGPQANGLQFRQGIEYYNITPWTIPMGIKLSVRF